MTHESPKNTPNGARPRAVLVAIKLPDVLPEAFASSVAELERLVTTLGYDVVEHITQTRQNLAPAAVLGEGKLEELGALTGGPGSVTSPVPKKNNKARAKWAEARGTEEYEPDPFDQDDEADGEPAESDIALVAVDHDLSPSQARNLERASGTAVLDRTGVIIEIFHRHAKSRQARVQVEIARLAYSAPRLRESPSGKERQRGKGTGEASLELDRRKIRDRIAELREELERIMAEQGTRQRARRDQRTVALVGYTNAGKSSLMRTLTGSQVLVEDKLFATLDTTIRALYPEVSPRILVSDTVGFIKKLPHDLVASFKSTLDEAAEASLLLHVVDAADPDWESQHEVTLEVLREIGAGDVAKTLIMNKVDKLGAPELASLQARYPDALFVSARLESDVKRLHEYIVAFFERDYVAAEFHVPYDRQRLVSEMHEVGVVDETRYEDEAVFVRFRGAPAAVERLTRAVAKSPEA